MLAAIPSAGAGAEGGTIRSVVLSSGGLAAIARSIAVDGAATIHIEVPLDQVDDLLKSLVVGDPGGTVSAASLIGLSPLDETFRTMPFTAEAMGSLPDLAASLQGTGARASVDGRTVEGTILGVGPFEVPQGDGEGTDHRTRPHPDDGFRRDRDRSAEDDRERRIPRSGGARQARQGRGRRRAEQGRSGARGRNQGRRSRQRDVTLTYVVSAPVWKTAYRVVLGEDGKARLQAWAVLENATGEDWQDVDVTLSSGSPVTLKQRLLESYWRERPEIPVFAGVQAPPRPDSGAAPRARLAAMEGAHGRSAGGTRLRRQGLAFAARPASPSSHGRRPWPRRARTRRPRCFICPERSACRRATR